MSLEAKCEAHSNTSINNILNELSEPLLLEKILYEKINNKMWSCLSWDREEWLSILGNESYRIQFGKRISAAEVQDSPQWEHTNLKGYMTFGKLLKWEKDGTNSSVCNTQISHSEYWAYLDYYYMKDLPGLKIIDENLSWECFGFPEIKAKDSTLWIGTAGANTPCHIDTYGVNIVCQVKGKKRWTLFPKVQTPYLYPTRVPYEESSIYSEVGFPRPNFKKFIKLNQTTPYVVTLEAGDVLLVPKHWWHFVENLEFSISINTWLPQPNDFQDRLKEALVLYQIGSLCQSVSSLSLLKSIFNDNMIERASLSSEDHINTLKENIERYLSERKSNDKDTMKKSNKKLKMENNFNFICKNVKKYTFKEYCSLIHIEYDNEGSLPHNLCNSDFQDNFLKVLINSFTDDRVITMLKTVFEENLQ